MGRLCQTAIRSFVTAYEVSAAPCNDGPAQRSRAEASDGRRRRGWSGDPCRRAPAPRLCPPLSARERLRPECTIPATSASEGQMESIIAKHLIRRCARSFIRMRDLRWRAVTSSGAAQPKASRFSMDAPTSQRQDTVSGRGVSDLHVRIDVTSHRDQGPVGYRLLLSRLLRHFPQQLCPKPGASSRWVLASRRPNGSDGCVRRFPACPQINGARGLTAILIVRHPRPRHHGRSFRFRFVQL
jgi:hypothetical protein